VGAPRLRPCFKPNADQGHLRPDARHPAARPREAPINPIGMFIFTRIPAELITSYSVAPKMNRATFNKPEAIAELTPIAE
jgi:hypothetical protein